MPTSKTVKKLRKKSVLLAVCFIPEISNGIQSDKRLKSVLLATCFLKFPQIEYQWRALLKPCSQYSKNPLIRNSLFQNRLGSFL